MAKKFGKYCALIIVLIAGNLRGQDMQFSQPYSNPLYLNPAFTGSEKATRVVLNYRKQWPGIGSGYNAYAASTDFYIKGMNAGLGVSAVKDIAGSNKLSNTLASVYYAQHLRVSRRSSLALAVKGSFGQRAFNAPDYLFADQIIRDSPTSLSLPQGITPAVNYADFSAGVLYFNTKMWLGISLHRINEPNQSLMGGIDVIPRKLSIHGGSLIPIADFEESNSEKKLRVAFNYKHQGHWDQLDLGAYYSFRGVNFGLWYRGLPIKPYKPGMTNNESLIFLLGYEATKRYSFGYSYDISVNQLFSHSGGAHEISVSALFHNRRKNTKRRIVPCAKF